MILRRTDEGIVAISQPAHAWVSGQMARAWGNGEFAGVPEEVCLAAEQHDLGFLDWERNPTLNPETNLPHTFLEMPRPMHLEIWTKGIRQAMAFGRYPALLVSLHYLWLLDRSKNNYPPEEKALLDEFRREQAVLQAELRSSLATHPCFEGCVGPETLKRNQQLVSTWDWISLLLCHGFAEPQRVENIPTASGYGALKFVPGKESFSFAVTPWPFRLPSLRMPCEGRLLLNRYRDEAHLRQTFGEAKKVAIVFQLMPA